MTRALPLLAAALAGCIGASAAVVRAPVAPVRVAPMSPAEVLTRSCGDSADAVDASRFFVCGARAEVIDGRAVFSEESFESNYASAFQVSEGWVFFSRIDGVVARADTFTGALRPLGRFEHGATATASRGRAAFVHRGALWLSDGRALTRAAVPGARVLGAAFADATHGAAVLVDGALVMTADGGARWTPVDLGGDRALRITSDDGLHVTLALRDALLGPDGSLTTAPRAASYPTPDASARDVVAAALRDADAPFLRRHLEGGAWASLDGAALRVHDASGGERTHVLFDGSLWGVRAESLVARWGRSLAVRFGDGQSWLWHRLTPDGHLTRMFAAGGAATVEFPERGVFWSDDGRHVAWLGRCPAAREEGRRDGDDADNDERSSSFDDASDRRDAVAPTTLCMLEDGVRRWRDVSLPDVGVAGVRWSVVGLHGASALLVNELEPTEYEVFDTASGATTIARTEDPSVHVGSLAWAFDGTLVGGGSRCADGCEPVVLRGAPERPLAVRAAPGAVGAVDFVDADRGVALADDFSTLWRTRDGGASWEVIARDVPHERTGGPSVICDADGCTAAERVRVRGWGPVTPSTRATLRAREVPAVEVGDAEQEASPRSVSHARLTCAVEGSSRPSPWHLGAVGRIGAWPDGVASYARDAEAMRISWWTQDRHGVVRAPRLRSDDSGSRPPFMVFGVGPAVHAVLSSEMQVVALDGAVARRLTDAPFDGSPTWVYAASGWQSRAVEGGGSIVSARLSTQPSTALVAELSARGEVRAWRVFLRAEAGGAVARREGRWGMYSVRGDGTGWFEGLRGEAPASSLPWRVTSRVCVGPAAADAVTLYTADEEGASGVYVTGAGQWQEVRAEVELSSAGACVRSIAATLSRSYVSEEERGERLTGEFSAHLTGASGDAMTGFADDGRRRMAIRCNLTSGN